MRSQNCCSVWSWLCFILMLRVNGDSRLYIWSGHNLNIQCERITNWLRICNDHGLGALGATRSIFAILHTDAQVNRRDAWCRRSNNILYPTDHNTSRKLERKCAVKADRTSKAIRDETSPAELDSYRNCLYLFHMHMFWCWCPKWEGSILVLDIEHRAWRYVYPITSQEAFKSQDQMFVHGSVR